MKDEPLVLLAIDTCGGSGSVAVGSFERRADAVDGGGAFLLLGTALLEGKTYAALLVARIDEMLREARLTLSQVHALVVVNGPGSFTGVRIGVSAAKGLSEGSGIPVIAVSRLELLARKGDGIRCVALDAGRGEFYFGVYGEGRRPLEALSTAAEMVDTMGDSEQGIVICEEALAPHLAGARLVSAPTAADALVVGFERFAAGLFDDAALLDGNYLRRPDAENTANRVAAAAGA